MIFLKIIGPTILDQFYMILIPYSRYARTVLQWRNSYGLRVGKPAGTRAEGAPVGCPFTLVLHLKLPFEKGHHLEKGNFSTALSNTFFHSLVAEFSYRCIP